MNKLTTVLVFAFMTLNINAQTKYSKYYSNIVDKSYDLMYAKQKGDKYTLYIEARSLDNISEKGGFAFNVKEHEQLLSSLTQAKEKFTEWSAIAEKNNVTELTKQIDIKCNSNLAYFYYGSELYLDFSVGLKFTFKAITTNDNTIYALIINSGELVSSKNEFIKSKGLSIIFTSSNEIDNFMNEISIDKIKSLLSEAPKEDLFK